MRKRLVIPLMLFLMLATLVNAAYLCENMVGDDELEIMGIEDSSRTGEDEWTWTPNENISIQVIVKNENYTERDFEVKLFLLKENYGIIENFTTSDNDIIKTVSLDKEESQTLNFSFQLNEIDAENYFLYAKFYDKNNESLYCTELRARDNGDEILVEMKDKKRLIVIRKIYGPEEITPGSTVEYITEIINLGDIAEDQVLVKIYNAAFQLREEKEILNLAIEESKNITFGFTIPNNVTTEQQIIFAIEYDYNQITGNYEEFSTNNKIFTTQIKQNTTIPEIINETSNSTTEQNTTPFTILPPEEDPAEETSILLWITIPVTLFIIIIALVVFFFTRKKNGVTPATSGDKVKKYVTEINQKQVPPIPRSPIPPNKPSGNYTANTKTPPTSQSPPPQPHSPSRPPITSSSPKPTPANTPVPPQAPQSPPQKSPPSPTPPRPNKTSSP
jgi:hypothetical protein